MPTRKEKRDLYRLEAGTGVLLAGAGASNRVPEAVNAGYKTLLRGEFKHRTRKGGVDDMGRAVDPEKLSNRQVIVQGPKGPIKEPKVTPRARAKRRVEQLRTELGEKTRGHRLPYPTSPANSDYGRLGHARRVKTAAGLMAVGIPIAFHGAHMAATTNDRIKRRKVYKRATKDDVDAAIGGGLAGGALYHVPSFVERARRTKVQDPSKITPQQAKDVLAWKAKYGVSDLQEGAPGWTKAYRNYPLHLPGARQSRIMAYTHSGKTGMALTGLAGVGAGAVAVKANRKHHKGKPMKVAKRESKPSLRRSKQVQAALSYGSATLGLSALGVKGGSVIARRIPKYAQYAGRLNDASLALTTTGAGVGGVSGFNFARQQRIEAKREKADRVLRKSFDSERDRRARQAAYTPLLAAGSAASGTAAAFTARKPIRTFRASQETMKWSAKSAKEADEFYRQAQSAKKWKKGVRWGQEKRGMSIIADKNARALAAKGKDLRFAALKQSKKPAAFALGAAGLGAAAIANERHRRTAGRTYDGWWGSHSY